VGGNTGDHRAPWKTQTPLAANTGEQLREEEGRSERTQNLSTPFAGGKKPNARRGVVPYNGYAATGRPKKTRRGEGAEHFRWQKSERGKVYFCGREKSRAHPLNTRTSSAVERGNKIDERDGKGGGKV